MKVSCESSLYTYTMKGELSQKFVESEAKRRAEVKVEFDGGAL